MALLNRNYRYRAMHAKAKLGYPWRSSGYYLEPIQHPQNQTFFNNSAELQIFYGWLEETSNQNGIDSFVKALARHKSQLEAFTDLQERVVLEIATARWLHKTVRVVINRICLERNYQRAYPNSHEHQQGLLQSVLLAALMHEVGLNSGVVGVWMDQEGHLNEGSHTVALLRLANGRDLLVDAVSPEPFPRHKGIYIWDAQKGEYGRVETCYALDVVIVGYLRFCEGKALLPAEVAPLDLPYLYSQFARSRGEPIGA